MSDYRVAIIGCGRPLRTEGATGFGMAHAHAKGFLTTPGCTLVACADIVPENAERFAEEYDIPATYTDYREMLAKEKPDIVSISTWPHLHAEMVIDAAKAGAKAIHCEKPMAPTFGEARRMKEECDRRGVQLTFNHQRRFSAPYVTAKRLLDEGAIGQLRRIEAACGNLFDWGTHWFDMLFFYNDDQPAEWVIGQIDCRTERGIFGVPLEDQGIAHVKFSNGVYGLVVTGYQHTIWAEHRLLGSEGIIEVEYPDVRVRGKGDAKMRVIHTKDEEDPVFLGVRDLVDALRTGREPVLSARKAFAATELIFATYESSRRRGRVDLPLQIEDSPFLSMLESGAIGPKRKG